MIKKSIKSILHLFMQFGQFLVFLLRSFRVSRTNTLKYCKQPIDNSRFAVIATGPSLKKEIDYILNGEYVATTDFLMLNFSAFDPLFFKLHPKYYCLADPMFFKSSWRDQEVSKFFNLIDTKVDWDMSIFVPALCRKSFKVFSNLKNEHIKIIGINNTEYFGFKTLRHFFYRKGMASPPPQTVTNMGIFIGVQNGYKSIDLFGVDHTFLSDLIVNENNQLCQKYYHSYDKEEPQYKLLVDTNTNKVWKIGEYIVACGKMFLSHDLIEEYAKSVNCKIVNHTKCSMIDSYERYNGQ